ncbi:hypothetical protein ABH940_003463 [Streptacidiphilus sp. BW17]|uniref:hypothetical protein n=1 Tax=Streptacidiphilus sp. BW17 TaxID=3156274 RepID=UPI0035179161
MTAISDALALQAWADAFHAQRGQLPWSFSRPRPLDSAAVARQLSELGRLISELGDEVLLRAEAGPAPGGRQARVVTGFASAMRPAGKAASALGEVAHQLAFLDQTEHLRDQPDARDAREAAVHVIAAALGAANHALHEAARSLRAAAATVAPPSVRVQAARSRSTNPIAASGPLPSTDTTTAPVPGRIARGR